MFEDSTFESTGRIHTHSRAWMIAAFSFNGLILLALVLVPLIYPEALGRQTMPLLMAVPAPPMEQKPPDPPPVHAAKAPTQVVDGHFQAPSSFPKEPFIPAGPEPSLPTADMSTIAELSVPGGTGPHGIPQPRVVRASPIGPMRVSSMVVAGLLIQKTIPTYPPVARAMRIDGTVALAATISKAGTIENLRVVSGPPMLQQAALDAVKTWRYRPYLLNGDPVEVETTVNVVFTLTR